MFDNLISIRLYYASKEKTKTRFYQKEFLSKKLGRPSPRQTAVINTYSVYVLSR